MASYLGSALLVLVGALAGLLGQLGWARHAKKARRRIPKHWPVDPRPLVNSQEKKVWHWLVRTFPDHQVMVKIPITRFTIPRASEDSALLYDLLNKVYCTFSVCSPGGNVVGCVDVRVGSKTISRSNQLLKLGLLSQCGVCYWIVEPDSLPEAAEIRAYFLADDAQPAAEDRGIGGHALASAKVQLRATVERQRHSRKSAGETRGAKKAAPAMKVDPLGSDFPESEFERGAWQQADSFVAPLDSRLSALH